MLFFVPDEAAAAAAVGAALRSPAVAVATAVVTAMQPKTWTGPFDFAVPVCGAFAAITTAAALAGRAGRYSERARLPAATAWTLSAVSFVYAFLLIPAGLLDVGNASPFSSLRKFGGSNSWVVPTGLLQRAFIDAPPDTLMGDAFGGGIVRVEFTNSSHLTYVARGPRLGARCRWPPHNRDLARTHAVVRAHQRRGPTEILAVRHPGAKRLLKDSGHCGGQYSANVNPLTHAYLTNTNARPQSMVRRTRRPSFARSHCPQPDRSPSPRITQSPPPA